MPIRLAIYSDLHLEFASWMPPRELDADVIILAGDIHTGTRGIEWAIRAFYPKPVIYVAGNHEFYGQDWQTLPLELHAAARGSNVVFLEQACHQLPIDGQTLTFLGATLWTDFALDGDFPAAMFQAPARMNDYNLIRDGDQPLLPETALARFEESLSWLSKTFEQAKPAGPSVVVTHHAPSGSSLGAKRRQLAPYYASDLAQFIHTLTPDLWIHGHTHSCQDYTIGRTRIVSNQRGYIGLGAEHTVDGFDPARLVELVAVRPPFP